MPFFRAGRYRLLVYPLAVLAVNLAVVWRLFRTEYLDQLPSIEGAFIALDRYIFRHWPGYDWFPLWYGGFPFSRTYQPGFHYSVAALAKLSGLSVPSAYHALAAVTYSLGGVAFYYLARVLTGDRGMALGGALVFSLFSPSALLIPAIRHDLDGFWHARRLQAMVEYGEAPNITGITLGMFALALLHRAVSSQNQPRPVLRYLFAALAIAATAATNWPATVALALAIFAYAVAHPARLPRMAIAGAMAYGLAAPFALPSTIVSTFANADVIGDGPTHGPARWISLGLLLVLMAVLRACRANFAVLYATLLVWIVVSAGWFNIRLLPQAMRFHVAMEIALVLGATVFLHWLCARRPNLRIPFAIATAAFCLLQFFHYREYARHHLIKRLDFPKTLEYQEARWFDQNVKTGRVLAPGTVSFWMNAVTETPQTVGCCEQSVLSKVDFILSSVTAAGYRTDAESADYTLLWMKAWAVQAFAIGGPASREHYKAFSFPNRFRDRFPILWSSGDDYIYRIPERAPDLARVVPASALVVHPPDNGIDDRELRPFVKALDDDTLPVPSYTSEDPNHAVVRATLRPDQAVSMAVSYHPGWSASANGRAVPLHADGLGLIAVEPHCAGDCTIRLAWSPGPEPALAWAVFGLTLTGSLALAFIRR